MTPLKKQYISQPYDWEYYATECSLPEPLCKQEPKHYPCVAVWSEVDNVEHAEYLYLSDFGPCTFRIEHMAYDQSTDDQNYTRCVSEDYEGMDGIERLLKEVKRIEAKVREGSHWKGEWADKKGPCITEITQVFPVNESLYKEAVLEGFAEGKARADSRIKLYEESAKLQKETFDRQEYLRLRNKYEGSL